TIKYNVRFLKCWCNHRDRLPSTSWNLHEERVRIRFMGLLSHSLRPVSPSHMPSATRIAAGNVLAGPAAGARILLVTDLPSRRDTHVPGHRYSAKQEGEGEEEGEEEWEGEEEGEREQERGGEMGGANIVAMRGEKGTAGEEDGVGSKDGLGLSQEGVRVEGGGEGERVGEDQRECERVKGEGREEGGGEKAKTEGRGSWE
ncbi:unnamed protein product, partial [Closterium sp. Naga37s-1]